MKIIVTEKQLKNIRIRRNITNELPKYITSAFEWLNPKAFKDFDEFLERVIFSATRDYAGEYVQDPNDYEQMKKELAPIVREMVMNVYYDEIVNYFNSHF